MGVRYIDYVDIELLQFDLLRNDSLLHFTTTIKGGVSQSNYTSLNLGFYSGDTVENITENRNKLANAIKINSDDLIVPYQTHGDKIALIDQYFLSMTTEEKSSYLNETDALITNQPDICIGVTTADCVPLLIFDPERKALAAIHAGWKGTAACIGQKTVKQMIAIFDCSPSDLLVAIGPSISSAHFEVGEEVGEAFANSGFCISEIAYRNADTGKLHIDLWEANKLPLLETGILPENIQLSEICTYSNPDLFFSARRQTVSSGRMITGGMIKEK